MVFLRNVRWFFTSNCNEKRKFLEARDTEERVRSMSGVTQGSHRGHTGVTQRTTGDHLSRVGRLTVS